MPVSNPSSKPWSAREIFLFRVIFIFLLLLTVPVRPSFYKQIFTADYLEGRFQDLYQLAHNVPAFTSFSNWGWYSYAGWLIALLLAVIGAFVWKAADKKAATQYNQLYYWLRVVIRYRLAIAFIGSGIILVLPLQLPYPTLSDLHTAYGDFLPWKIYYHSTAVAVAGYRETIGVLEIIGALLLLNRKTVVFGAIIISFILVNIVLANFAYEIGDHLYSSYLLLLALLLIAYDYKRLLAILVTKSKAFADRFEPVYTGWIKKWRQPIRIAFLALAVFTGVFAYANYKNHSNWPYPQAAGLPGAAGYYNVRSFTINNTPLPYAFNDSVRWQDVVFEKWNTLSIRTTYPHLPSRVSPSIVYHDDKDRDYEFIGNGGRVFYSYQVSDSAIALQNRADSTDRLHFVVSRPDKQTILLNGVNQKGDSLSVVLNKVPKEYLLLKGRRKPVSVY